MNLPDALKMSKMHKARIHHENVTTTVEQVPNGYRVSYSDKRRDYMTFDALSVFLGQEVVQADWTALQEESEDEHMSDPFDDLSFEEAINPTNWTEETRLHTPTFEARLTADGTLWLSGAALAEGFSVSDVQALTRFLSERVQVPPLAPVEDFEGFTARRVDIEQEEA